MDEKNYPNPFKLFIDLLNYNLETLNRMIQMNMMFNKLVNERISNLQTMSNDNNDTTKKVLIKEIVQIPSEIVDTTKSQPNINNLGFDTPQVKSTSEKTAEQALEDMNLELINNKPISALPFLDSEQIMKLNLYGIHTIKDLKERNIDDVSKKTGISRSNLIF